MTLLLALTWLLHPTADALPLHDAAGAQRLDLLPTLEVEDATGRRTLRFTVDAATGVAQLTAPGFTARLTTRQAPGIIEQTLEIKDTSDRVVRSEAVVFRAARGPIEVLDRAYRFGPVKGPTIIGPATPAVARWHGVLLEGGPGVQALAARPGRAPTLRLELDHRDNHPFRVYPRCTEHPENTLPDRLLDDSPRPAGGARTMRWTWRPDARLLAVPARFPDARPAALALTDHADQGSLARTAAFAYGRADWAAGRAAGEGFVGRGLRYTKTVFLARAPGYAPQLDDPAFRALALALQADGVEIGVHSPSGRRDLPAAADALLADFRKDFNGLTWIDHGPADNCEALTNQGADPASPWYMIPTLTRHGFTTAWMIPDQLTGVGGNLLRPERPDLRAPTLVRPPRLAPLRLFTTAWLFVDKKALLSRYRPAALDALAAAHGFSVGHTYLDTLRSEGPHAGRSLLETTRDGPRLLPDVERWLDDLAARQRDGRLWVTGIAALADHLEAALASTRAYADDAVTITPPAPLPGLTLLLIPLAGQTITGAQVDGEVAPLQTLAGHAAVVLPPKGGRVVPTTRP